jgi:hypothetical protein
MKENAFKWVPHRVFTLTWGDEVLPIHILYLYWVIGADDSERVKSPWLLSIGRNVETVFASRKLSIRRYSRKTQCLFTGKTLAKSKNFVVSRPKKQELYFFGVFLWYIENNELVCFFVRT